MCGWHLRFSMLSNMVFRIRGSQDISPSINGWGVNRSDRTNDVDKSGIEGHQGTLIDSLVQYGTSALLGYGGTDYGTLSATSVSIVTMVWGIQPPPSYRLLTLLYIVLPEFD